MARQITPRNIITCSRGFTLLEITIVLTIISVMSLLVIPRITGFFEGKRSNFLILTTMVAKTFDDSFLKDRTNFLMIHLYEPGEESLETDEIFSRKNGISVVKIDKDGKFADSGNRLLKYKEFSDSFKIEEVVLSTGEKIGTGNVLVPFYPGGYSDNVILHIRVNDEEEWSVRIFKLKKEAEIFREFTDFSKL